MASERNQPFLLGINRHFTLHAVKNLSLNGSRLKIRVGSEGQRHQVSMTTRVVEHKHISQYLEQALPLFCLLAARLLRCPLLVWATHEPLYTLLLLLLLSGVKGVAINKEQSTERTVSGLDNLLDLSLPGFFLFHLVHPVAVLSML